MELGKILIEENIKNISSRSLFTKFEKRNLESHEYYFDTLKIVNAFTLRLGESFYKVNLYIQRTEYMDDIPRQYFTITMTDLKPYWGWTYRIGQHEPIELIRAAEQVLTNYTSSCVSAIDHDFTLPFGQFVAITAQNNSDWHYQYGHAKTYAVIGAQYILEQ